MSCDERSGPCTVVWAGLANAWSPLNELPIHEFGAELGSSGPDRFHPGPEVTVHYLLFYDLADDAAERRAPLRNAHLSLAWEAHDRGELVLGGALDQPMDGTVLLFQGQGPEGAEAFARADPYVTHGLVTGWRVRPWNTVVGTQATSPVHPEAGSG